MKDETGNLVTVMIIKVPLYLEIDGKFKPEDARQIVDEARTSVSRYFSEINGGIIRVNGHKLVKSMKILSEIEVRQRLGKQIQVVEEKSKTP